MTPRRLLVAVVTLSFLAGACTSDPEPGAKPQRDRPSPAERGGGTIDMGVIGEPATFDPYSPVATDLTYALVRPLYRSLYRFAPDGSAEPDLAESLQQGPTGVTVTLVGAEWSDGTPLTARDVVASARRARPPSGFAGLKASALDARTVEFVGEVGDWEQRLATVAYVLPRGRAKSGLFSGPLRITSRVPGLRVTYRPNPKWSPRVDFNRLRVFFVEESSMLRSLLSDDKLDAGAVLSSVNLPDRLEAAEVHFDWTLGWESIRLNLTPSSLTESERAGVAATIDRGGLAEGFVRNLGRVTNTLTPGPGPNGADGEFVKPPESGALPATLSLAIPDGDELLSLVQRAIQLQLADAGVRVDLVHINARTFYGAWQREAPVDALLLRAAGAPGLSRDGIDDLASVPLFQVASFIAGDGVSGYAANPTFDGPLWNVTEWRAIDPE